MSLTGVINLLLRRQRRTFLIVSAAAFVAVIIATILLPRIYETDTTLFVGENRPLAASAEAVQLDEALTASYVELLQTPDIEQKVVDQLSFPISASELGSEVDVHALAGTRLIVITAGDRDPERAQEIANTYAETFVKDRLENARQVDTDRLDTLTGRISSLATSIAKLEEQGTSADVGKLASKRSELEAVEASYRDALANAGLAAYNVSVSSDAALPSSPARPRPKAYLFVGLILSLALGAAAAIARNTFDPRVAESDEILELLGGPLLASIPARTRSGESEARIQNAAQFLRVNVSMSGSGGSAAHVIAVTSASEGDGKTTVATYLASALASAGARVVAVDCDLRRPRLGSVLGSGSEKGVSDALLGDKDVENLVVPVSDRLLLLAAGPRPPDPGTLLDAGGLETIIDGLRGIAQYIIIDTPPVLAGAETAAIFEAADGVVLVADATHSRRDHLKATVQQLEKIEATVLGVVLNRVSSRHGAYGYYGYAMEGGSSGIRGGWSRGRGGDRSSHADSTSSR